MKFKDIFFSRSDRYSIGIEEESETYYIAIPVNNQLIEYEEYYRITQEEFEKLRSNIADAKHFADRCRQRLEDSRLLEKPGALRGSPS